MKAVCRRLETRYRYYIDIGYDNCPWPTSTTKQNEKITQSVELRYVQQKNGRSVMRLYGFNTKMT